MRLPDYLAGQQINFETILHPPAFSAQKRAKRLRLPGRHVAKSVLLRGPEGFLLAVLPATRQIDTSRLAEILRGPVRLATNAEIADVFRDCEWGVVSSFGAVYGLVVMLDETLDANDWIVFETTSRFEAVRMRCGDYERIERPRRACFSR
jgi:Ala-tRNA(Pro) deacylase